MATMAAAMPLRASANPYLVTIAVMLGSFMTILDSTIANVALPHMQPSLGAASDTIAWVLTSYIVATAITTPLTGWLAEKLGRRQLFLYSVVGFTLASMACGLAQSLEQMVFFRMLQGAAGATLAPLGQAYVLDAWPREKHGKAMAYWGVGIMVGPILGPVIGGWLTESFDWRWVFFINLPFGILTFFLASAVLPNITSTLRRFDLIGFTLLAVGVGALQLFLDRGQQLDWFDSWEVRIEAGIALAALWAFGVHVMTADGAIVDRRMLRDRNVMTGFMFITLVGMLLVGTTALLPTMLQNLFGYPVIETGILQMPRGMGMMLAMLTVGQIIGKVDARILITTGLSLAALAMYMMTLFSPTMGAMPIIVSGFVQGAGLGMIFVSLNTLAFATLPMDLRTDASGFYMLLRNLGGSIGISLTVGVLSRQAQISHADLGASLTPYALPWTNDAIARTLGLDVVTAMLDATVNKQAAMIAYLDVFRMMFWVTVAMMPLLLLLRRPRAPGPAVHLAD